MPADTHARADARERTVSWEDPAVSARRGLELSGVDYIRAMLGGEVASPPMAALLGFGLNEVEEGRVVFQAEPSEYHYNPMNTVHGGLALTMLDSAMGAAVHTTLMRGQLYSTLEVKVNMVRAITADTGTIRAEGRVLHRGGATATAEARLRSAADDRLLAHGTATCFILGGEGR